jgi:hypothetical protein
MSAPCVNLEDFTEANREELEKLDRIAETLEGGERCQEFIIQAIAIQGVLKFMFRLAAKAARKTESMEETVSIWECMRAACDAVASHLKQLQERHPECGGDDLYDVALDLRNAASRRIELHM